ncbi:MAG: hypothetical protein ACO3SY_04625 [Flavobacteriaceae bacterium]
MNTAPLIKIKHQYIGSGKQKSVISFYEDTIQFQFQPDHIPKTIYYHEIEQIICLKRKRIYYISCCLAVLLLGIVTFHFLVSDGSIYNLISVIFLVLTAVVNYKEAGTLIQVKRGALKTEVFKSYKKKEVEEVLRLLKKYQAQAESNGLVNSK